MHRSFKEFSKDFSEWIEPFTERTLVYEAPIPNIEFDLRVLMEYSLAREFMKKWLEEVMKMELMFDQSLTTTRCELLLPEGKITMTMPPEAQCDCDGKCKSACAKNCPYASREMVETPFGWVSEFALIGITDFDNPISQFYRHIGEQARQLYELLEKHGIGNSPVTSDILMQSGIQDTIKLHRYINDWLRVAEFLDMEM